MDPALLEELIARGHSHELISNVAVVQAISIAAPHAAEERSDANVGENSSAPPRLIAVSDPRKGGSPRGR